MPSHHLALPVGPLGQKQQRESAMAFTISAEGMADGRCQGPGDALVRGSSADHLAHGELLDVWFSPPVRFPPPPSLPRTVELGGRKSARDSQKSMIPQPLSIGPEASKSILFGGVRSGLTWSGTWSNCSWVIPASLMRIPTAIAEPTFKSESSTPITASLDPRRCSPDSRASSSAGTRICRRSDVRKPNRRVAPRQRQGEPASVALNSKDFKTCAVV